MSDKRVTELLQGIQKSNIAAHGQTDEPKAQGGLLQRCAGRLDVGIPELAYFETDIDRQQALKRARQAQGIRRRMRHLQAIIWVVVFCGMLYFQFVVTSKIALLSFIAMIVGGVVVTEHRTEWGRKPIRTHLRKQLIARGVPICLACGYDLRGLPEARCPECGNVN